MLCECTSDTCDKTIELSDAVASDIQAKRLVAIAHDCPQGPEPTDQLIETRVGYNLYRARDFV